MTLEYVSYVRSFSLNILATNTITILYKLWRWIVFLLFALFVADCFFVAGISVFSSTKCDLANLLLSFHLHFALAISSGSYVCMRMCVLLHKMYNYNFAFAKWILHWKITLWPFQMTRQTILCSVFVACFF